MKRFTVSRKIEVEISRQIEAENFGDAEVEAKALKLDRLVKVAPGADLVDWNDLPGMWIIEEP